MSRIVSVIKIGDYQTPINILIEQTLDCKTMDCPPITKRTVELGAQHSPDTVCTPFKVLTGNFIEALDKGANAIIMPAFGCRLGFYYMLHKQILEDLGYKFEMLTLFEYHATANKLYTSLSEYNPELTRERFDKVFALVCRIVLDMDWLADYMRRNAAFEMNKGEFEKNYQKYLKEAAKLVNVETAIILGEKYKKIFLETKINKPSKPIRIGIVGDLYSVIEPHGNCDIFKWLIDNGVEVISQIDLSYFSTSVFDVTSNIAKSGGYVNYQLGGNANNTVSLSLAMAQGFAHSATCPKPEKEWVDGIIHVKAATCMPEITAMTVLQNIASDYGVPIMYLTFDTETSEAGMHTRWEAFLDMLQMKRSEK